MGMDADGLVFYGAVVNDSQESGPQPFYAPDSWDGKEWVYVYAERMGRSP